MAAVAIEPMAFGCRRDAANMRRARGNRHVNRRQGQRCCLDRR
jgi:hypothetical protein